MIRLFQSRPWMVGAGSPEERSFRLEICEVIRWKNYLTRCEWDRRHWGSAEWIGKREREREGGQKGRWEGVELPNRTSGSDFLSFFPFDLLLKACLAMARRAFFMQFPPFSPLQPPSQVLSNWVSSLWQLWENCSSRNEICVSVRQPPCVSLRDLDVTKPRGTSRQRPVWVGHKGESHRESLIYVVLWLIDLDGCCCCKSRGGWHKFARKFLWDRCPLLLSTFLWKWRRFVSLLSRLARTKVITGLGSPSQDCVLPTCPIDWQRPATKVGLILGKQGICV